MAAKAIANPVLLQSTSVSDIVVDAEKNEPNRDMFPQTIPQSLATDVWSEHEILLASFLLPSNI